MKPILWSSVLLVALLLTACLPLGAPAGFQADAASPCASTICPSHDRSLRTMPSARDLSPFADALAGLSAERVAALDALLADATILDMQQALAAGVLTSTELVTYYVDRIQRYDIDKLNSVMELNPAGAGDCQPVGRRTGGGQVRGNLHGIPVLLRDNICHRRRVAQQRWRLCIAQLAARPRCLSVQQLRAAGSHYSGQSQSLRMEPIIWIPACPAVFEYPGRPGAQPLWSLRNHGSSSGSAVAVAANLAAVSVGTETKARSG
ncbi:MAG: amidase family protein [Caldilineaceae bacterium]